MTAEAKRLCFESATRQLNRSQHILDLLDGRDGFVRHQPLDALFMHHEAIVSELQAFIAEIKPL